ncbi:MAG: ABC transporter substrate-binding protein [Acetobacteraceae bacterium]|nr:ABC transporter substrate-binding protein [Acetobacteraceae bacterium]
MPIRIGVLTDLSGQYSDTAGVTSIACTQQAIDEARAAAPGLQVELLSADHQQKADLALNIARQWIDRDGVDVITNCNNSAIGLAISNLCHDRNKVSLNTGAATAELTGSACNANLVQWTYDTWEIAHSTGVSTVQSGGDKWFFIAADYAFGRAMQADLTRWVTQAGGKVLGTAFYPFPGTTDFSSFLLQGQASGANVIGLLNAGGDFVNCIKQAHEFGIMPPKVKLAGTAAFINSIHALGLETAQGLTYTESFYWDLNDRTRAFTKRAVARTPDNYPNQIQAGDYSATTHYLKIVNQMGMAQAKASGAATVAAMKAMPTDDDAYGKGSIRIDGRHVHDVYLLEAKRPSESKGEWDLLKVVKTVPAAEAFRPLADGGCPLVRS